MGIEMPITVVPTVLIVTLLLVFAISRRFLRS